MHRLFLASLFFLMTLGLVSGEEAVKKVTISLTTKAQASVEADLAFIHFSVYGENENAVDSERLLRKRSETLEKDLALPSATSISEITSCALIATTLEIGFKNQASTSVVHQRRYVIIIKHYDKTKDKLISQLVDQLASLGLADEVNVGYGIEDPDKVKNKAYKLAIESAIKRAKVIAECLNKTLSDAYQVKDNSCPETITNTSKANLNSSSTEIKAVIDLTVEFETK